MNDGNFDDPENADNPIVLNISSKLTLHDNDKIRVSEEGQLVGDEDARLVAKHSIRADHCREQLKSKCDRLST